MLRCPPLGSSFSLFFFLSPQNFGCTRGFLTSKALAILSGNDEQISLFLLPKCPTKEALVCDNEIAEVDKEEKSGDKQLSLLHLEDDSFPGMSSTPPKKKANKRGTTVVGS